jgi:hypothetical protein
MERYFESVACSNMPDEIFLPKTFLYSSCLGMTGIFLFFCKAEQTSGESQTVSSKITPESTLQQDQRKPE